MGGAAVTYDGAHAASRIPEESRREKQTSQINTRMSVSLKERGEAGFAAANLTSSEAIRMLYEFAAAHAHQPEALRRALSLDEERDERDALRLRKLEGFVQGGSLVPTFFETTGARGVDPDLASLPYKQLEERAYADRYESGA